jgi:type II secretory pathway component PulK
MTSESRPGFVLVAVLVVVVLLSLAAYQFGDLMTAEYRAADSYARSAQARALADSGVHYLAALLSSPDAMANTLNNNPYDNAGAFQGIVVNGQDLPENQGRFSVIGLLAPDDPNVQAQSYRFGVEDESGKINLNALMQLDSSGQVAHDMLLKLPNMTEDIANSILDWIDADDESRANGAESDYYASLSPPYRAKNGPLDSVEELLFVKGVTPPLLLGNDRNHNGVLDPDEDDGSGAVDRGWSAYLTVYSREQNVDSQGNPRIYINDQNLDTLYQNLSTAVGQDLANYILAYRIYGPASSQSGGGGGGGAGGGGGGGSAGGRGGAGGGNNSGSGMGSGAGGGAGMSGAGGGAGQAAAGGRLSRGQIDTRNARPRSISSLYELINSSVSIPAANPQQRPTSYPSPLNDSGAIRQLLPQLLDECTTTRNQEMPARINVNTASQTVLQTLPSLNDSDIQNILAHRPDPSAAQAPDPIYQTPAWLITEANVAPSTLRSLERYITARSQVYRAQVIGYFDRGGPSARVEAVIDTNQGQPRILYLRDLTELGKGFNLAGQGNQPAP